MSLRNVTLTAVAALSFGMAADAQETRTITVPLNAPGAEAPAASGPGTTVTLNPDGTTAVEAAGAAAPTPADVDAGTEAAVTVTGEPADAGAFTVQPGSGTTEGAVPPSQEEGTAHPAIGHTGGTVTPEKPAPAASKAEEAATAATGTANEGVVTTTPVPSPVPGEPPAAPKEGLPAAATEAQVTAPVPAAEGAVEAEVPGGAPAETSAPSSEAAEPAAVPAEPAAEPALDLAPAGEAPAAIQNPQEQQVAPTTADAGAATAPATEETATSIADEAAQAAEVVPADAAATHEQQITDVSFSFEGSFGTYDQLQLQRGLQVYTEVCAGCHGMKQVALRTLSDPGGPGLPPDQVRAYAAELSIMDPETEEERPRLPTDHFPTVSGEGMGPDLSLMAKARAGFHGPYGTGLSQLFNGIGGPEYIYSILTHYTGESKDEAGATLYENTAFPGGWIAMPPPLSDDQVTFEDGSPSDLHSEAKDLAAFLMWAAEPKMMARKQAGLVSVLFLIVLTSLLYLTNKRLWRPLKYGRDEIGDGR